MADQNETIQVEQPNEPQDDPKQEKTVPYARFAEVNKALKDLQTWKAEQEAAGKKAEEAKLKEQAKWRELAETKDAELKQERLERLRLKVVMTKGLPTEMADRLKGETEEELTKDADALTALMKPQQQDQPKGKGVPPVSGGKPVTTDLSKMTPAEIREQHGFGGKSRKK
jgi:hypothetical protein